jgi:hypothetical protein
MKCRNSALICSRRIIVNNRTGKGKIDEKIYICSSRGEERRGGAQEKAKTDRMKLSLPPKLVKKSNLGPKLYLVFVKFSFPVTCLMAYYAES